MLEDQTKDRSLTDLASEQEEQSNWSGAAELYERALKQTPHGDNQRVGDILEQKAYAFHMAALQAHSSDEFEKRTLEAIDCYKQAIRTYGDAAEPWISGRKHQCDAMIAYLGCWLAGDSAKKKKLADEAWNHAKAALSIFEAAGRLNDFATVFNQLSYSVAFSYNYDGKAESRENKLKEALSYAEKSVRYLSSSDDRTALARAHAKATGLMVAIERDFAPFGDKDRIDLEAWDHWLKAREISEEAALKEIPYMIILQSWPAACSTEERSVIYSKGKEVSDKTGNHFMTGCVLDGLAQRKFSVAFSTDDSREMGVLFKEGFETAKASQDNLAKVHFVSPNVICVWVPVPEAGYYFFFASREKDPNAKRELFYKAQEPCREQLRLAKTSGYPDVECAAQFMLGSVLKELGKTESGIDMKKTYLENAIVHLKEAIEGDRRIHPTQYYPQGLDLLSLAEAHYELAQITIDLDAKRKVLEEAILRKEEALDVCEKELTCTQASNPDLSGEIATGYHTTGDWAKELCVVAKETSCLPKVARFFEKAVEWYAKAGLHSQSAESNWEAAETYDKMGEFLRANERFELAAVDYGKAAENVPRLKEFYADHAIYMRAWSEIERAKYHHQRQEPGQAKECYENASAMHKSTRRWNYLATNYLAWAEIEHAEDLSRNEKHDEAVKSFEEAARLFQDSKKSLHGQLTRIEDSDEKQSARNLERAAGTRGNYCAARIIVEKARSLDKQGDVSASADKYGQAADLFEKILGDLESDQDRKEIQLVAALSRAWEAMAKAESETSPDHYDKASQLFEQAKDLSTGEKSKLLMAGHSRFCKALGIGARFVDTGDMALHAEATKNLESAADYYLKAGHRKESDYAKASKMLFDGYVHMGKASREEDQVKKSKLYMMAEKVLRTSASSYEKAKELGKRDQVLRLLEKVKEERELALSLTDVLHAPDVVSNMAAFPSPVPSHESATGLERFEHADVQVALIAHPKHLRVGQDLEIVIEMTNAGKEVASLIRVDDLFPKGFDVITKPDAWQVEENHLDLRGKRLDALSSEVVKLVLKPSANGKYTLKPRILYQDESGKYKSHEPEPIGVTVVGEAMAPPDKAVAADTREAAEARSLLAGLNVVTLSHYRIVGNYVRYGGDVRNALKDARQKIVAACGHWSPKRENYIIWAPPGSGKTYFVQEVAALLGNSVHYRELNLAKLDEAGFRSGLAELRDVQGPHLCLVDEVDAKPEEPWPYEALMPFLDVSATEGTQLVFVLAGSSGSSLEEMKRTIATRPKGSDILSRVPTDNEYSIPPMGVGDRLLVVLSQFRQAGKQMGHEVREVEKLGLYYVALNPRLSNARQLREFAVRCAERVLPGDDRLKYDSLFRPGDLENKLFWTQALQSAGALVDSFLLVEE